MTILTPRMLLHRPHGFLALPPSLAPPVLTAWLSLFRPHFTALVWNHILQVHVVQNTGYNRFSLMHASAVV